MESAWSNGKPAYRCCDGHATAAKPDPARTKNAYVREDRILPHLPALRLLLSDADSADGRRRRTRRGVDIRNQTRAEEVTGYLREHQLTVTCDRAAGTLRAAASEATQAITLTGS